MCMCMEMCILQTKTYWKGEISWNCNFKFLKCKNEICQWIELKEYMRKMGAIRLVMFTPRVMVIKMSQMTNFLYFWLRTTKISPSLGKILKRIWKLLFSSIRKCYGLLGSGLILAKCQQLKIQDFGILLLTEHFFIFLPNG